ncbi:MAG TPA: hypothetical protein VMB52_00705 [Verrucomicrobiae bacterium]|nr:hypothetical protein [Verrucomicrobiae bacterium]
MLKLDKHGVQIALGILWLLDGALQLQHQMFTSNFATQVIAPAAQGQPLFVSGPIHFGIHLFLLHPAIFNALFALTQLGLGILILWWRTRKLGLLLSIPWCLIVWVFGEGYGGIFSGHTLLLMGAPGAVSLYAILALAVIPSKRREKEQQAAFWLALIWLVLWVGGGVYQLLPGQESTSDISAMITGNVQGAPGWLAAVDSHVAKGITDLGRVNSSTTSTPSQLDATMDMTSPQMMHMTNEPYTPKQGASGYVFVLVFAMLQVCIGLGVLFSGPWRKLAIWLGVLLSLVFWVVGQSLGAYFTGLATDPSSGPLFIMLGLAILGCVDLDLKLSMLNHRIEEVLVGKSSG